MLTTSPLVACQIESQEACKVGGGRVSAAGWCLINSHTPAQIDEEEVHSDVEAHLPERAHVLSHEDFSLLRHVSESRGEEHAQRLSS